MERRRHGVDRQPPRRSREYPSFSSTLLDAIYRSIDETDGRAAPEHVFVRKQSTAFFPEGRKGTTQAIYSAATYSRRPATSSSSEGSSYGGFSSSDAESLPTLPPTRLRPIRTTPAARAGRDGRDPPMSSRFDEKRAKKDCHGSIRSHLRDLRNGRSPSSPGARLANFLSSLFAAKSKVSSELPCSTASSHSRSCLSKTPTTGKRTVSFRPVSVIVGGDRRPCGETWAYGIDRPSQSVAPAVRSVAIDQEDEEDDLFELKNLAVTGRFPDELPVYETTRLGNYGGGPRGMIC